MRTPSPPMSRMVVLPHETACTTSAKSAPSAQSSAARLNLVFNWCLKTNLEQTSYEHRQSSRVLCKFAITLSQLTNVACTAAGKPLGKTGQPLESEPTSHGNQLVLHVLHARTSLASPWHSALSQTGQVNKSPQLSQKTTLPASSGNSKERIQIGHFVREPHEGQDGRRGSDIVKNPLQPGHVVENTSPVHAVSGYKGTAPRAGAGSRVGRPSLTKAEHTATI
mmetsp:Transcript_58348/g.131426  ORF Transcript_58348/g.131426 Transcript_58348/m.131426 type:complete len:223 (+) Transcript_58348:765-1433(+)